jgi:hypothetical protein
MEQCIRDEIVQFNAAMTSTQDTHVTMYLPLLQ